MFEFISLIEVSDSHTQDEGIRSEASEEIREYIEIDDDTCHMLETCHGLEMSENDCFGLS